LRTWNDPPRIALPPEEHALKNAASLGAQKGHIQPLASVQVTVFALVPGFLAPARSVVEKTSIRRLLPSKINLCVS
jgi:hypothetical protein